MIFYSLFFERPSYTNTRLTTTSLTRSFPNRMLYMYITIPFMNFASQLLTNVIVKLYAGTNFFFEKLKSTFSFKTIILSRYCIKNTLKSSGGQTRRLYTYRVSLSHFKISELKKFVLGKIENDFSDQNEYPHKIFHKKNTENKNHKEVKLADHALHSTLYMYRL